MNATKKTGFSFGVILGALVGTGALILAHQKEGKHLRTKVIDQLKSLKEKYPDQINTIEDVLTTALSEANVLTKELREIRNAGDKSTTAKTAKPKVRTFTRSGKPV